MRGTGRKKDDDGTETMMSQRDCVEIPKGTKAVNNRAGDIAWYQEKRAGIKKGGTEEQTGTEKGGTPWLVVPEG